MSAEFFHPCERQLLREIAKCGELHQSVRRFVTRYGSQAEKQAAEAGAQSPRGLYLQSLADSVGLVLEPFHQKLTQLIEDHLKNPNRVLSYYYNQIKPFESYFRFLLHFIGELETGQFHGCAVLKLLHKHNFNGDQRIMRAIQAVRKSVYAVWLRQLSQWLIYGRLIDAFGEFLITHSDANKAKGVYSLATATSMPNISATCATISDSAAVNADLWHYEVCYDMLPPNFTPSWAEKVLFIGQTVRMLNADPRRLDKKRSLWTNGDFEAEMGCLWNKREHVYFNKLQALYDDDCIDVGAYEAIVNEIKLFVTERLSEIAFNQADLIKHLHLVKDYYLLGRGELFLEFIIQTESLLVERGKISEYMARDVSQAFQVALNRSSVELEQLVLHMPLTDVETIDLEHCDDDPHVFLRLVAFKFSVKWPLHLLFSPTILKRYNQIFRFLLQIRKVQNDLHTVWRLHRDRKVAGNSLLSQLRNQMLFLVDNLQYYLQVDVIESQFSILMSAVQNSKDFEVIQRAHSVFQANVMSLCFQFSGNPNAGGGGNMNGSHLKGSEAENPVLSILNKILHTIRYFCRLNAACASPLTHEEHQQLELSHST